MSVTLFYDGEIKKTSDGILAGMTARVTIFNDSIDLTVDWKNGTRSVDQRLRHCRIGRLSLDTNILFPKILSHLLERVPKPLWL
jgi:hypothetical protein